MELRNLNYSQEGNMAGAERASSRGMPWKRGKQHEMESEQASEIDELRRVTNDGGVLFLRMRRHISIFKIIATRILWEEVGFHFNSTVWAGLSRSQATGPRERHEMETSRSN